MNKKVIIGNLQIITNAAKEAQLESDLMAIFGKCEFTYEELSVFLKEGKPYSMDRTSVQEAEYTRAYAEDYYNNVCRDEKAKEILGKIL